MNATFCDLKITCLVVLHVRELSCMTRHILRRCEEEADNSMSHPGGGGREADQSSQFFLSYQRSKATNLNGTPSAPQGSVFTRWELS